MKLVYIAGPYRAKNAWLVEQNIREAEQWAYRVASAGAMPVCPHTNTRGYFESIGTPEFWLGGTLELARRCDAILLIPMWHTSKGAVAESIEMRRLGKMVFYHSDLDILEAWASG